jgi:thiol-disulfide isomerase/thioredoxin
MQIIKIGAVWCPGCLVMNKIWNNILKNNDLDIIELDYDINNDEVIKYNVGKVLPVIIFMDDEGIEIERLVGEQKEDKLRILIDRYIDR